MTTVFVEAPARLHFGMLDLGGSLGRRFGGIGAGLAAPSLLLSATRDGDGAGIVAAAARGVDDTHGGVPGLAGALDAAVDAACSAARRFLAVHGVGGAEAEVRIVLHRVLPAHRGLGSGTQLAMATARAIAELYDMPTEAADLARAAGRARRSAIGTYVFAHGGFILEGGRRETGGRPAPLLARLPIPAEWRCVLAVPLGRSGVSGSAEVAAFAALPTPPAAEAERVAHLTLMALLPAIAEGQFEAFADALTEIQRINGGWFAAAQGGRYAAGPSAALIEILMSGGARAVGQSSWGPAVYGLVPSADAGRSLAAHVRRESSARGIGDTIVCDTEFSHTGARVWLE